MKNLNLPNFLSASRIIFLPVLFWLLFAGHENLFLPVYIILASTDLFDGMAARKMGLTSRLGKELDSIADLFFYISSAYFMYYLFPEVIRANNTYLIAFFSLMGLSFIVSGIKFRKPIMMHSTLLRLNAVLVTMVVVLSFWVDTTYFVRAVLFIYFVGFCEAIAMFIFFGNVDPDTKSIFHLMRNSKKEI